MATKIDLTGQRFGRLVVIAEAETANGKSGWLCRCDCGNETIVHGSNLRRGSTQSCGCYLREFYKSRSEAMKTHGSEPRRLYNIWCGMRTRCRNPHTNRYSHYGGRGITVCDEWDDYTVFRDWALSHGYREDLSIDRIDVNGKYEPDNCRWIAMADQSKNRSTINWIELNGKRISLSDACRETGVKYCSVWKRAKNSGMSYQEAFDLLKSKSQAINGGNA